MNPVQIQFVNVDTQELLLEYYLHQIPAVGTILQWDGDELEVVRVLWNFADPGFPDKAGVIFVTAEVAYRPK